MITYGTLQERVEVDVIQEHFEEDVFNPNKHEIQVARDPMHACFKKLKSKACKGLVFGTNKGFISLGVFAEIRSAQKKKLPVYHVTMDGVVEFSGHMRLVKRDKTRRWARIYADDNN